MADKFQNKYRIPSARWQAWDYSSEGLYFITINVEHHTCLLGSIVDKEMYLSEFGQIVIEEWNRSFEMRSELFCDAYVIMPNHIHAILRIENPIAAIVETHGRASDNADNPNMRNIETHGRASDNADNPNMRNIKTHGRASDNADNPNMRNIETHGRASLRDGNTSSIRDCNRGNGIAFREPKSISSFVGGIKSIVTKRINILRQTPGKKFWQNRFHDHVIRDYEECRRIDAYIESNIANWNDDRYFKE